MSFRPSPLSRRAVFRTAGAGCAAAVLSACAPKVRAIDDAAHAQNTSTSASAVSSSASPSPSSHRDYTGEVQFSSFDTSAGAYEPATQEHPAKNAPKPIRPSDISEKSAAGFYAAIGYTTAAMQYAMETMDFSPLADAYPREYKDALESKFNQLKQRTIESNSWFGSPIFKASVTSSEPNMNGTSATWEGTISYSLGTFYGPGGMHRDSPATTSDTVYRGTYEDGRWWVFPDSASGSSGSGSSKEFSL